MPNSYFQFKQFRIHQERCAMKVGTDGVLLGTWLQPGAAMRILDIGTGTGLIALCLAQRCSAPIDAIELDAEAAAQAAENAAASPWAARIRVIQADVRTYRPDVRYDVIVCNPPFFRNSLPAPLKERNMARHDAHLTLEDLLQTAQALLTGSGVFALILPSDASARLEALCQTHGLHLQRRCYVQTVPGKQAKRMLYQFGREAVHAVDETLCLQDMHGKRSPQYANLTADYYL